MVKTLLTLMNYFSVIDLPHVIMFSRKLLVENITFLGIAPTAVKTNALQKH